MKKIYAVETEYFKVSKPFRYATEWDYLNKMKNLNAGDTFTRWFSTLEEALYSMRHVPQRTSNIPSLASPGPIEFARDTLSAYTVPINLPIDAVDAWLSDIDGKEEQDFYDSEEVIPLHDALLLTQTIHKDDPYKKVESPESDVYIYDYSGVCVMSAQDYVEAYAKYPFRIAGSDVVFDSDTVMRGVDSEDSLRIWKELFYTDHLYNDGPPTPFVSLDAMKDNAIDNENVEWLRDIEQYECDLVNKAKYRYSFEDGAESKVGTISDILADYHKLQESHDYLAPVTSFDETCYQLGYDSEALTTETYKEVLDEQLKDIKESIDEEDGYVFICELIKTWSKKI